MSVDTTSDTSPRSGSPAQVEQRWQHLQPAVMHFIEQQCLPNSFLPLVEQWYWPMAQQLGNELSKNEHGYRCVGVNGAQGTGKSTLASLLKLILEQVFDLRCAVLSLDDFYRTRQERLVMAANVNPLLAVRGVPGTHDISLALSTIDQLLAAKEGDSVRLPGFDKSIDDRKPASECASITGPVDLIIVEGWCVGATPQTAQQLATAVNRLEREKDPDGSWRHYVNTQLAGDYQVLFQRLERLVMLKAPSTEVVEEWRWLQESKLIEASGGKGEGLMSREQVAEFIQYYERLTRHCLATLPERADCVFYLNADHGIASASGSLLQ